jgi:5-methylcytosine-specific restriction endonuclease McrA
MHGALHRRYAKRTRLGDFWPDRTPAPRGPDIVIRPEPSGAGRQKLRWRLWVRDPYCVWCGFLFVHPDFATAEHLLPIAFGGRDTMRNCRLACEHCNNERGCWYTKQLKAIAKRIGIELHTLYGRIQGLG